MTIMSALLALAPANALGTHASTTASPRPCLLQPKLGVRRWISRRGGDLTAFVVGFLRGPLSRDIQTQFRPRY